MSDSEILIRVENVSKKFCRRLKQALWYGMRDLTSELLGRSNSHNELRKDEFWAVDDVSFELKRGECLGLIGRNGAGKSTLLKMLNGLIKPDKGRISVRGHVGALIELGAGFNPILTGRENIYVNAAVLGISRHQVDQKLDTIIEFAEIEDFIDTPVQYYSSGMRVRLGFAVAAHMGPDVLLIDEVLAVGDMGFVMKCLNAIDRMMSNAAVIFVSHNIPFVSRLCTQLIVLEKGKTIFNDADIAKGIDLYYTKFKSPIQTFTGTGEVEILDVRFSSSGGNQKSKEPFTISYLEDFYIEIDLKIAPKYRTPWIALVIYDKLVRPVAGCFPQDGDDSVRNKNGYISVRITIPRLNLTQGVYTLTISVTEDHYGGQVLLRHQSIREFRVSAPFIGWSPIQFKGQWKQLN